MPKPILVVAIDLEDYIEVLKANFPDVRFLATGSDGISATERESVDVLVTDGHIGASAAQINRFPNLRLIACVGTGHENIDVAEARRKGIALSYGAGANAETVADHAIGLLLSAVRKIPELDRRAREGEGGWRPPSLFGVIHRKRLGLLGYGRIGQAIARRALGFDMRVAYLARTDKPDLPGRPCSSAIELATESDIIISTLPGGAGTEHMIDSAFLRALGPGGYVVNVGRGSVVNSEDLANALGAGTIAGAALDVFEDEPVIPRCLLESPNLVLTPHVGGASQEARSLSYERLVANIHAVRAGHAPVTPLP